MRTLKDSTDAPTTGGTLRLRGPGDVDQLDPARSLQSPADQLQRLYARQLFTYPPRENPDDWQAIDPVPDLAAAVPSTYNAGLGASHTYHVVHLRRGVLWDTEPAREVTAHDVIRGIKRMCAPTARPAALGYFTSVVRGMAAYCARYAEAVGGAAADQHRHAGFQNAHDIPGIFALDAQTLVVELLRPTLDLPQILALPCAAAAPAEYDAVVPAPATSPRTRAPTAPTGSRSTAPARPCGWSPTRPGGGRPTPCGRGAWTRWR
ncbi:hypothetical protein [Nocardiopsis sp. CNR-923]|uniref:hypothetical protein n=1 Tax=Nocardiopsis sp. CNR-923 TaxID=1904965 RepID=UPI0021CCAA61|nr:hypothetical protein [Nocardiopsis sp. CNR-923]